MRARYSNVLLLVAAILAFLPVMAVDFLLDIYVRGRERTDLQQRTETVASRVQATAYEALGDIRQLISNGPSLCSPAFVEQARLLIEQGTAIRQVLVENINGVQFCDALGRTMSFRPLSEELAIPGRSEKLRLVTVGASNLPMLQVSLVFGAGRKLSVFAPAKPEAAQSTIQGFATGSMVRLQLTDGTLISEMGDAATYDARSGTEYLEASALAGDLPIRVSAALPFANARAGYGVLDTAFTLLTCLSFGTWLLVALRFVRRNELPAFDLERAIALGEIRPYYQPVIDLRTGQLAGCEVLCRWEKRSGEIVQPGLFIEYAETTGLAIPMTVSLMHQVSQDLDELNRLVPGLKVSINLFEGHFRDNRIVEDVHNIFGPSALKFRQLVFEVTERSPIDKHPHTKSVIAGLHALGCRLAMDDAGTGHSNLAYMQTLGVDIIKIDRVFVDMIKTGVQQVPVLDGLINMSRELGTDVIAEGVETEEQAVYLRARGVVMAQGYLFAPPLKAKAYCNFARAVNAHMIDQKSEAEEPAPQQTVTAA
jgi:sensor c-di-GMP phosphodiesterase-like protein